MAKRKHGVRFSGRRLIKARKLMDEILVSLDPNYDPEDGVQIRDGGVVIGDGVVQLDDDVEQAHKELEIVARVISNLHLVRIDDAGVYERLKEFSLIHQASVESIVTQFLDYSLETLGEAMTETMIESFSASGPGQA